MKNLIFLYIVSLSSIFAQFGDNKIQYKNHEWYYIQTEHFDIYFDQDGFELADFASGIAEQSLESIQLDLKYQINSRISIIIYNSHNNFQETNTTNSMLGQGTGGFTEPFKNRVVLPFDGSYKLYRHVIHHELVHAVMSDLLYGGSLQNIISRNINLNLPIWVHEGFAEFLSSTWESKSDMFIRDAVQNEYLPDIQNLNGYFAYRGGEALFYYISEKYGREKVGELLKKTHDFGSLKKGFKESLGLDIDELNKQWKKYLKRKYWPEIDEREDPEEFARRLTDNKKTGGYYNTSPAISPQGDKIIFISDQDITYDIYTMDANTGKNIEKVVSTGQTIDFEELNVLYPSLTWSPDNIHVALSEKSEGFDRIAIINAKTGETTFLPFKFESIGSVSWASDFKQITFEASNTKQSDIYIFNVETEELTNLTDDIFSDHEPKWAPDNKTIYFSSDRQEYITKESVPEDFRMLNYNFESTDIYSIQIEKKEIKRITNWKLSDELSPIVSPDGKKLIFVSDKNGIFNIYRLNLEENSQSLQPNSKTNAFPITNSLNEVNQLSASADGKKLVFSSMYNSSYNIFMILNPFEKEVVADSLTNTQFMNKLLARGKPLYSIPFDSAYVNFVKDDDSLATSEGQISPNIVQKDSIQIQPDSTFTKEGDYEIFSGQYINEENPEIANADYSNFVFGRDTVFTPVDTSKINLKELFVENLDNDGNFLVKKYKVHFSPDLVFANVGYSTFYGVLGYTTMAYSDVLGDHQIIGTLGLQSDLKNSDYGIAYYYLPNRIDYGFELFHTARYIYLIGQNGYDLNRFRNFSALVSAKYPLNKFYSLSVSLNFMHLIAENLDDFTSPENTSFYTIPALSFSHNNTMWGYYSPIQGTRFRLTLMGNLGLVNSQESFYSLLWDFRKYTRFWFDNSLVFRFSGGYSGGANPQRFFIGGTEGWLNYSWGKSSIPIGKPSDFLFLTPGLPLRGFDYSDKLGTKYALFNFEYRFPLFRYIVTGPIPLLLQNILGNAFIDAGTAWTENSSLKLTKKNMFGEKVLDDLLVGSGFGIRTYFIFMWKIDVAWTYDLQSWSKPRYYFSMGLDF